MVFSSVVLLDLLGLVMVMMELFRGSVRCW